MRLNIFSYTLALLLICFVQKSESQMIHPFVKKGLILHKMGNKDNRNPNQCIPGLVESYGFESTITVKNETLSACPGFNSTCCSYESQKLMILQMQKDTENLEERFAAQNKIIFGLLDELKLDMRYINRFLKRQETEDISNCQVIAKKLNFHDIERVEDSLKKDREEMEKFFMLTYKGVYCAACSPQNQKNLNLDRMLVRTSLKFCRDMVFNSVKPLMYLHYEFRTFLNLMVQFMTDCDERGNYTKNEIPHEITFYRGEDEKIVRECFENRDDPEWYIFCGRFCDMFSATEYKDFFEPNMDVMLHILNHLKTKRMHLNVIEKADSTIDADTKVRDVELNPTTVAPIDNSKVVQEEDEEDPYEPENQDARHAPMNRMEIEVFLTKFKDRKAVSGDIGGKLSLSDFEFKWSKKGMDYNSIGREAVSTNALLKVVETKIYAMEKEAKTIETASDDSSSGDKAKPKNVSKKGRSTLQIYSASRLSLGMILLAFGQWL